MAETDENRKAGGVACPFVFSPQHTTDPLFLTAHAWPPPAKTELNTPTGGVASPTLLSPQQAIRFA